MQAREFLEELSAVDGTEADARVAQCELDLAIHAARVQRDGAAAHGGHGCNGVLNEIADHDIHRKRVGERFESARNICNERDALLTCALFHLAHHSRNGRTDIDGLTLEIHASALETHTVENARDERFHASEIRQHALDERPLFRRRQRAHGHGFE